MSRHITTFIIKNSATDYMKDSYIKRKCGDLLYEALKNNAGKNHYAVRIDITSEAHADIKTAYSVLVDVIEAPLMEVTYG